MKEQDLYKYINEFISRVPQPGRRQILEKKVAALKKRISDAKTKADTHVDKVHKKEGVEVFDLELARRPDDIQKEIDLAKLDFDAEYINQTIEEHYEVNELHFEMIADIRKQRELEKFYASELLAVLNQPGHANTRANIPLVLRLVQKAENPNTILSIPEFDQLCTSLDAIALIAGVGLNPVVERNTEKLLNVVVEQMFTRRLPLNPDLYLVIQYFYTGINRSYNRILARQLVRDPDATKANEITEMFIGTFTDKLITTQLGNFVSPAITAAIVAAKSDAARNKILNNIYYTLYNGLFGHKYSIIDKYFTELRGYKTEFKTGNHTVAYDHIKQLNILYKAEPNDAVKKFIDDIVETNTDFTHALPLFKKLIGATSVLTFSHQVYLHEQRLINDTDFSVMCVNFYLKYRDSFYDQVKGNINVLLDEGKAADYYPAFIYENKIEPDFNAKVSFTDWQKNLRVLPGNCFTDIPVSVDQKDELKSYKLEDEYTLLDYLWMKIIKAPRVDPVDEKQAQALIADAEINEHTFTGPLLSCEHGINYKPPGTGIKNDVAYFIEHYLQHTGTDVLFQKPVAIPAPALPAVPKSKRKPKPKKPVPPPVPAPAAIPVPGPAAAPALPPPAAVPASVPPPVPVPPASSAAIPVPPPGPAAVPPVPASVGGLIPKTGGNVNLKDTNPLFIVVGLLILLVLYLIYELISYLFIQDQDPPNTNRDPY